MLQSYPICKASLVFAGFHYVGVEDGISTYQYREIEVSLKNNRADRVVIYTSNDTESMDFPGCKTLKQLVQLRKMRYNK